MKRLLQSEREIRTDNDETNDDSDIFRKRIEKLFDFFQKVFVFFSKINQFAQKKGFFI